MEGGPEPVYGSWVIEGLQEGVGYMARVQAKNRYGWSDHSETFYFFAEAHGGCCYIIISEIIILYDSRVRARAKQAELH